MLAPNPQQLNPQAGPAQPGLTGLNPMLMQQGSSGLNMPAPKLHDVVVTRSKTFAQARVVPVPPEEFGISRLTRILKETNYCFHQVMSNQDKLIAEGFDEEQIKGLPTYIRVTNLETIARDTVDENSYGGNEGDRATRQIQITEHYCRLDYEKNGKPCLYKVTTGGSAGSEVVLLKDGKPDIEPMDVIPFAAMTPVIVTHRFFGRSIADLVMDIQQIKTSLMRSWLDNQYLANNPRTMVYESMASDNTLDDLLVSRPGGIVRAKSPGAIEQFKHTSISADILPAMGYLDSTREFRTGVTRQGQGVDADALQNQSATAVNQVFSAAQARMKLIARIFAETGIRDMFMLLHAIIRKHGQERQTVQLRNKWVEVDPRDWKKRNDMTVTVGLGDGGKTEQVAHLAVLMNAQKEMILGELPTVTPQNIYNSGRELAKILKYKDPDLFFTDPSQNPQASMSRPNPKMVEVEGKLQIAQQAAQAKQQTDAAKTTAKAQSDFAKVQTTAQAKQAQLVAEFGLKQDQMRKEFDLKLAEITASHQLERQQASHKMAMSEKLTDAKISDVRFGGEVG